MVDNTCPAQQLGSVLLFGTVVLSLGWRLRISAAAEPAEAPRAMAAATRNSSSGTTCEERAACIRAACDVRDRFAACKHSLYHVGAALLAGENNQRGRIRTGINVESDSYGLCVCAERCALFKALSEGDVPGTFRFMAVATRDGGVSCGACRQLLAEYCPPDMVIHFVDTAGKVIRERTVSQMLPDPFVLKPPAALDSRAN